MYINVFYATMCKKLNENNNALYAPITSSSKGLKSSLRSTVCSFWPVFQNFPPKTLMLDKQIQQIASFFGNFSLMCVFIKVRDKVMNNDLSKKLSNAEKIELFKVVRNTIYESKCRKITDQIF